MPELAELLRDHVDGAAPPITLDEVERRVAEGGGGAPRPTSWQRWAVAALVLAVLAVAAVALLAATVGEDPQDLDVIGPPDEGADASTPTGMLTVAVRRPEGTVVPGQDVVLLRVVDGDGQQVGGVLVAPPSEVYDPAAEPGSVGRDVTTLIEAPALAFGDYELTVWADPCDGPCPVPGDDLPSEPADGEVACTGPVTVGALEAQVTAVLGADSCEHLGEPTRAHHEAADRLLEHQQEAGWVPADMTPASPDFSSGEGWVRSVQGVMHIPCDLPVPGPKGFAYGCIYDEPDGEVIGIHVAGVGYLPLEEVAGFDFAAAAKAREIEGVRSWIEMNEQRHDDPTLTDQERVMVEQLLEQARTKLRALEGG